MEDTTNSTGGPLRYEYGPKKAPLTLEEARVVDAAAAEAKALEHGTLYCYWHAGRLVCITGESKNTRRAA